MKVGVYTAVDSLESFKEVWTTFVRNFVRLTGQSEIDPNDEVAFLEFKNALFERYQRLKGSGSIGDAPKDFVAGVESLAGLQSLSSLSDEQLSSWKEAIQRAGYELDHWLEGIRIQHAKLAELRKSRRHENFKVFFMVPAFFGMLVALFVFFGLKFFLNR